MNRVIFTAALCLIASMSFAQKKAVKEAKSALNSNNLGEARELIKPALTNPETAEDAETWKVAGDIEDKAFDNESINQKLAQAVNEENMYNGLYNSYRPYIIADSLGQLPDAKGKIKNKYRKDIVARMTANHPYYVNGGLFYNERKEYSKAADFFQIYWDMPNLEMFEGKGRDIIMNDTIYQIVKYYALVCAREAGEHERAIKYIDKILDEPFVENDTYQEFELYELKTVEYLALGDTAKYIQALEAGAQKYPTNKYFIPNLINEFIRRKQVEEALNYLDKAIANDPANACELYSVKANIYTEKGEFDNAFSAYTQALSADENCERALESFAVSYIVKAQELKDQASQAPSRKEQTELDEEASEYYKRAFPLLERYRAQLELRNADKLEIKAALYKLRNVYYNLNMNDEFESVDQEYETLDKAGV